MTWMSVAIGLALSHLTVVYSLVKDRKDEHSAILFLYHGVMRPCMVLGIMHAISLVTN